MILPNAVLHTVGDHATLLPRLQERLADGGSLAVQMLDMTGEPAYRLLGEVAADGPWARSLAGTTR